VLHRFQVCNKLLKYKNKGLRYALVNKKTHKKKGKPLLLEREKNWHSSAVLWSPHRIDKAAEFRVRKKSRKRRQKSSRKQPIRS
jgi:hypothetical protein